jgi:4-hydroxy 2-oxovalerate aldolase
MIKTLDCTIRDGGYINNWNFSDSQVIELYTSLVKANIDYMEIGFRDNIERYNNKLVSKWRITQDIDINNTIKNIYNDSTKISVMVNYGSSDLNDLDTKENSLISLVRVALKKKDLKNAIKYAGQIKKKGYIVSANLMATINYSESELIEACKLIIDNNIDYVYIADSYGSMSSQKLSYLINFIRNQFNIIEPSYNYKIGFHGHNNTQQAFNNYKVCIDNKIDIIDSTMSGIGRGGGNLATEILIGDLYQNDKRFNIDSVYYIVTYINNNLRDEIFKSYNLYFFISGLLNVHPNYASKIKEYNINDISRVWKLLLTISKDHYYRDIFDISYFDSLLKINY